MAGKDFVDITPRGVDEGTGVRGLQNTVFQDTDRIQITENPGRLTKEGIDEKIRLWSRSINAHTLIKYKAMKLNCKNVRPSGLTEDNEIILSYDAEGNPNWTKPKMDKIVKKIKK